MGSRAFFILKESIWKKTELLAPAGDMKAAKAAFAAGADACYIGGSFSARAYAANFGREEILELVRYAHLRDKKVYVALNIMLKQSEMEAALLEAAFLYDIGVDAVIASDLGFIRQARSLFPNLPLHASTQMGVQDAAERDWPRNLGAAGWWRLGKARWGGWLAWPERA